MSLACPEADARQLMDATTSSLCLQAQEISGYARGWLGAANPVDGAPDRCLRLRVLRNAEYTKQEIPTNVGNLVNAGADVYTMAIHHWCGWGTCRKLS